MKKVTSPPIVTGHPTRLSDVWFQHESPRRLDLVVPVTYRDLLQRRALDMGLPAAERYVADRTVVEDAYRTALGIDNDVLSFTYATAVGFHRMGSPDDYPGFTYFFRLTRSQVESTLFGVVTGDPHLSVPTERGLRALERCLELWNRYSDLFVMVDDPELGQVDPRIEVVFQFPVRPELFVTQDEDRVPLADLI